MTNVRFLVLKYDETNWDVISGDGHLAYSYLDEEFGHIKIQRYSDAIEKPVFTYEGLLEQLALGDSYIEDLETFSSMNNEIFEELIKELSSFEVGKVEITTHAIPRDTPSGWEAIARALINEFLFGDTQKAPCPKCAKEQVCANVQENGEAVKMCTECKTIL